jgi:hypothetical protein
MRLASPTTLRNTLTTWTDTNKNSREDSHG